MSRAGEHCLRGRLLTVLIAALAVALLANVGCRKERPKVEPVPAAEARAATPSAEALPGAEAEATETEAAPAERTLQDTIVVRVHGYAITQSQVVKIAAELMRSSRAPEGANPTQFERAASAAALRQLVAHRLIVEAAKKEKLSVTDEQVMARIREIPELRNQYEGNLDRYLKAKGLSLRRLMDDTTEDMLYRAYLQAYIFPRVSVTPAEVFAYFADHEAEYQDTRTVNLSAIAIFKNETARGRAEDALRQIRDGALFADVAKKVSEDREHASEGGDWGWTDPKDLRGEAVVEALRTLPVGQVSDLLESDIAFWILLVKERRVPRQVTVEEVYRQIDRRLFAEKAQEETDKEVRRLTKEAPIDPPEMVRELLREP